MSCVRAASELHSSCVQAVIYSSALLTARESEIVYFLLDGLPKDAICQQLCISANTLKKHTLNIYKKLDIKSWRELFRLIK